MQFINPIHLLHLDGREAITIDENEIKKAKRRLFADIDLSEDQHYAYSGIKVTKSDCERVIDQLDSREKKEFYCYLAENGDLNSFLVSGSPGFFQTFRQESIYKLPQFVDFLAPFFPIRFEKAFHNAFCRSDTELLKAIIKSQILIRKQDLNQAYRGVTNEIDSRIREIELIKEDIKSGDTNYTEDNVEELVEVVKEKFPVDSINLLPPYFQSQINKIADCINYLGLAVWNEFSVTETPMLLEEHLLTLNIESVSKPIFEKNHRIYKKRNEEEIELKIHSGEVERWTHVLLELRKLDQAVETKATSPSDAFLEAQRLIQLSELNSLGEYAVALRDQITLSIRSLSISSWNTNNDMASALKLINFALTIDCPSETKAKLNNDRLQLEELERKYHDSLYCWFCGTNHPSEAAAFTFAMYKETSRTFFPRGVKYSAVNLTLRRCQNCKQIHNSGSSKYWVVWIICLCAGGFLGQLINEHYIIGAIAGIIVGHFAGGSAESGQSEKLGIKSLDKSSLSAHSLVKEQLLQGWQFEEPTA